jgi:tripartite-type tricarboxylate transporter receptor subunit TctC
VRLMKATGAKFEHIPYKGASAAIPDLLGGNVDFYVSSVPSVQSQVSAGKVRLLATTGSKRSPIFPDVPTAGETYKGFQAVSWYGILAPAGTPRPILARLNAEINKALKDPAVRKSIEAEGGEVLGGKAEDFASYIKAEIAMWSPLVKDSGAKVD